MKKQIYQKPAMRIVKLQHSQMLCTSGITDVNGGDTGIGYGGGGNGPARASSHGGIWDNGNE
ncbi:MAG: hypothetical protein IJ722_02955 [Alloprevotella sp.]|nr:hypothetical protein [Alloprevotella sp.]